MVSEDQLWEALKSVKDPELMLDVVTLGLIYTVKIGSEVRITMTMTFPGCPYGPQLVDEVKKAAQAVSGGEVTVEVTFDPPWEIGKISPEGKLLLGIS